MILHRSFVCPWVLVSAVQRESLAFRSHHCQSIEKSCSVLMDIAFELYARDQYPIYPRETQGVCLPLLRNQYIQKLPRPAVSLLEEPAFTRHKRCEANFNLDAGSLETYRHDTAFFRICAQLSSSESMLFSLLQFVCHQACLRYVVFCFRAKHAAAICIVCLRFALVW